MIHHTHHIRRLFMLALGAVVATLFVLPAAPAQAAGGMTQISGVGVFVDECDGESSLFTIAMSGDLDGCWYTDAFEVVQTTDSGIYQERGEERFVGCIAALDACGTFTTTYKFTAKFDEEGEIHGRCQHPITKGSGTEGFDGIEGRVDFKDDVETGEFLYRGHVRLT